MGFISSAKSKVSSVVSKVVSVSKSIASPTAPSSGTSSTTSSSSSTYTGGKSVQTTPGKTGGVQYGQGTITVVPSSSPSGGILPPSGSSSGRGGSTSAVQPSGATAPSGYLIPPGTKLGGVSVAQKAITPQKVSVVKKVVTAPFTFAAGQYEWQKKLLPNEERRQQLEQQRIDAEKSQSLSSLFQRGNLPGAVRKASDVAAGKYLTVTEAARVKASGKPLTESQFQTTKGFIADTGLFAGFGIAMPTSGELAKSISKSSNVAFMGTSQTQESGLIKTNALFKVTSGNKLEYGRATGITGQAELSEGLTGSVTFAAGKKSVGRSIEFPTGTITHKVEKFAGVDVGVSRELGDTGFSLQASKGFSFKPRTELRTRDLSQYKSFGISQQTDDLTKSLTWLRGNKGNAKSVGLIRDLSSKDSAEMFKVTRTGNNILLRPTTTLKQQALTGTQNIVSSRFTVAPKNPTLKLPSTTRNIFAATSSSLALRPTTQGRSLIGIPRMVGGQGLTESQLTRSSTLPLSTTSTSQFSITNQKSNLSQLTNQLSGNRFREGLRSGQITEQAQRQAQRQIAIPRLQLRQLQKQKSVGGLTFRVQPKIKMPVAFFGFPSFQLPKGKGRKRRSKFGMNIKRQPSLYAIGTGLKSTSFGKIESSGFTIRPIIISKRKNKRRKR